MSIPHGPAFGHRERSTVFAFPVGCFFPLTYCDIKMCGGAEKLREIFQIPS
jgi:hypothetical protein